MGLFVSINSNATMLNDEIIERLIKNPPYKINVTVYGGSDEEMLESITRLYKMMGINDIYPGHNRETTMDYEKRRNRFMRRFR